MSVQPMLQRLEEMADLHRRLLALGRRKTRVLVDGLVDELAEITAEENRLVGRITVVERDLFQHAEQFLSEKGFPHDASPTLTDVIKLVFDPRERGALQSARAELLKLLGELRPVNELNRNLIEQSLAFVRHSIDTMTASPEDDMLYRHPDQQDQRYLGRGLFDARA